jgi:hypothetical protein
MLDVGQSRNQEIIESPKLPREELPRARDSLPNSPERPGSGSPSRVAVLPDHVKRNRAICLWMIP